MSKAINLVNYDDLRLISKLLDNDGKFFRLWYFKVLGNAVDFAKSVQDFLMLSTDFEGSQKLVGLSKAYGVFKSKLGWIVQ